MSSEAVSLRLCLAVSKLLSWFVDTHNARGRGEEQPTVLDVRAWAVANHVLNVVVEAIHTWVNTEDIAVLSGS